MTRRQVTMRKGLNIAVQCEACGHQFSYQRTVTKTKESGTGLFSPSASELASKTKAEVDKELEEIKEKKSFGYKPCPQCGYVQSWMAEDFTNRVGCVTSIWVYIVLTIILIAFSMLTAFGNQDWWNGWGFFVYLFCVGPILTFIIGMVIAQMNFKPNRLWLKEHGTPPDVKEPNISITTNPSVSEGFKHTWDNRIKLFFILPMIYFKGK